MNHTVYKANSLDLCAHQQLTGATSICTWTSFLLSVLGESHSQYYFLQYYCNNSRQHTQVTRQAVLPITELKFQGFLFAFQTLRLLSFAFSSLSMQLPLLEFISSALPSQYQCHVGKTDPGDYYNQYVSPTNTTKNHLVIKDVWHN